MARLLPSRPMSPTSTCGGVKVSVKHNMKDGSYKLDIRRTEQKKIVQPFPVKETECVNCHDKRNCTNAIIFRHWEMYCNKYHGTIRKDLKTKTGRFVWKLPKCGQNTYWGENTWWGWLICDVGKLSLLTMREVTITIRTDRSCKITVAGKIQVIQVLQVFCIIGLFEIDFMGQNAEMFCVHVHQPMLFSSRQTWTDYHNLIVSKNWFILL